MNATEAAPPPQRHGCLTAVLVFVLIASGSLNNAPLSAVCGGDLSAPFAESKALDRRPTLELRKLG